ncbi:MAG: TatD family hydrolase [Bacilli bacterium]|nr:TatD family hydrolase [Bacilli bacterium]
MKIDTHCHLSKKEYANLDEIIKHMENDIIVCSGASMEDNESTLELVSKYSNIYGTIGFHPDEIYNVDESSFAYLEDNISNKKIVGIGEIGLDYYHDGDKIKQQDLFIKQLELARKYNMPVVIHSRDAASDTYDILKKYSDLKIIMHCYSYSLEMAYKFVELGCKLGIGGVLTFKNGKKLVEVVENIDIENLVLETDSPYLTPEPYRGMQNEPYNITLVAKKIAELKGISVEKVYEVTTKNACEIYGIKL